MAFPVAPTNGQTAVVNNITYQFSNVGNTWTRILSTANVITANTLNVNNNLSIVGNILTTANISGNYILGNGSQLTGIATGSSSNITNGTSNVTVVSSGGNVTVGIGGTGNVAVFATTGEYVTGIISASGNIISAANIRGGNVLTGGAISATGTLSVTGNTTVANVSAGNISAGSLSTSGLISATANITGGNILTAGVISAASTITGSSFSGAGTGLTGTASSLTVGTATTAGTVTTAAQPNITSVGTLTALTVSGNATGGNILTGGLVSAVGNVTGGNLVTVGLISATGNITGNYFLGNGSALTGITPGGTTTFSNTAPVSPAIGDVWIQANTAVQYIYFNDTTSNQWAEIEAFQSFSSGGGAGTPGGANTQIQFNDSDSFGASANLTFNKTTNTLAAIVVSATGNITGSYILGNGSQLTGVMMMSWSIANSNATMAASNGYFVDTSGGAKTMTLPASAVIGDTVRINDLAGTFGANNLTVGRNSSNIQGVAQDLVVSVNQSSFGLVYSNSTYGWKLLEL